MRFKSQSCRIPLHCFALLILCLGCQLIYTTERRQCFAGFGLVLVDATQQLPCPPSLFSCTASHRPTVWDFTVMNHDLTALTSNRRAHQVDVLPILYIPTMPIPTPQLCILIVLTVQNPQAQSQVAQVLFSISLDGKTVAFESHSIWEEVSLSSSSSAKQHMIWCNAVMVVVTN